jgi:hypothetical protein
MQYFSAAFRRRIRHSAEMFLLLALLLGFAISLSFLEDWLRHHHRPAWILIGVQTLTVISFVTDAISFGLVCINLLYHGMKELWRNLQQ